jgi:hypothetical protein
MKTHFMHQPMLSKKDYIFVLLAVVAAAAMAGAVVRHLRSSALESLVTPPSSVADVPSSVPEPPAMMAGDWRWASDDGGAAFSLSLRQAGGEVSGTYCAVAQGGARVDCALEEDGDNVVGSVIGQSAELSFVSPYSGATGRAALRTSGDRLIWRITENPAGEFWAPQEAELAAWLGEADGGPASAPDPAMPEEGQSFIVALAPGYDKESSAPVQPRAWLREGLGPLSDLPCVSELGFWQGDLFLSHSDRNLPLENQPNAGFFQAIQYSTDVCVWNHDGLLMGRLLAPLDWGAASAYFPISKFGLLAGDPRVFWAYHQNLQAGEDAACVLSMISQEHPGQHRRVTIVDGEDRVWPHCWEEVDFDLRDADLIDGPIRYRIREGGRQWSEWQIATPQAAPGFEG